MKQTLIIEHLAALGLLEQCDTQAIAEAKQLFWASRRKQCRAERRKHTKSVQIFFSKSDYANLKLKAKKCKMPVAGFVKESILQALQNDTGIYQRQLLELRKHVLSVLSDFDNDIISLNEQEEHLLHLQASLTLLITLLRAHDD